MSAPVNSTATLLLELGDRVRRSWWTAIAGVCVGLAAATVALQYIPKVYEATTRIWIAEQEISESVVLSTVKDDMALKLAAFRDAVLADEYMIVLIERSFGAPKTDEELTDRMARVRHNVSIEPINSKRLGVQAFALAYRDADPRRAASVVNLLAQLYVSQNSTLRKASAFKVADAIQTMADKVKSEFDVVDTRLTRFRQQHQFETEQHLATNLQLLESRKRDVDALTVRRDQIRRDQRIAQEEIIQARNQAQLTTGVTTGTIMIDPLSQKIALAKAQLESLRVRYTEGHPEVQHAHRELEDLLSQAADRADETPEHDVGQSNLSSNPIIASIQKRLQELDGEMAQMESEEAALAREIAEYERRIQITPEVQRQLTDLDEENAVVREKWRKLERQAEGAKGSIDLEENDMAQSMEILTEAGVPGSPIEPNPHVIYLVFVLGGVVLFVGPMLARHLLNPPITSEVGLRALTALPVLVSIPRIMTPTNRGLSRRNLVKNIAFSLAAGVILLSVEIYLQGGG